MTEPLVPPPAAVDPLPTDSGLDPAAPAPVAGPPAVRWWVVAIFGAWSFGVWATRIYNIWEDVLLSTDEKVLLTIVALVFVGVGIGVFFVGVSLRRWFPTSTDRIAVGLLGGWTLGVWFSRVIDIVFGGDHEVPFIVVHVVLAVVSLGLAGWSWWEIGEAKAQEDAARRSAAVTAPRPEAVASSAAVEPQG